MSIKSKRGILLACWLLFMVLVSCDDDEPEHLPSPDEQGYIWLWNVKSLPLLKSSIKGHWKIHYAFGGLNGQTKVPHTDSWFHYLANDSMYLVFNGFPYAATKPTFLHKETVYGYDAWLLQFDYNNAWGLKDELIIEALHGDTLALNSNSVDSYVYIMTKQ